MTSSYYTYKTECLGVELDGSQTLRAWGTGKNKKDAIEQAKKNAIHDILFQGIHDGQSKCSVKPLLTEVNAADKYEDYFNAFFQDKGSYQTFVSGEENGRTTRIQEAIKNQLKYGIVVFRTKKTLTSRWYTKIKNNHEYKNTHIIYRFLDQFISSIWPGAKTKIDGYPQR